MIQFPLTLAYTMEIHKAQGSIVSRAVLNISGREFSPGLTYVAVSHVKTLKGILFEEAFNFDLLLVINPSLSVKIRLANAESYESQRVFTPSLP